MHIVSLYLDLRRNIAGKHGVVVRACQLLYNKIPILHKPVERGDRSSKLHDCAPQPGTESSDICKDRLVHSKEMDSNRVVIDAEWLPCTWSFVDLALLVVMDVESYPSLPSLGGSYVCHGGCKAQPS